MADGQIVITTKVTKNTKKEEEAIRRMKSEISKKASMANKRLRRLESNNLTSSPAYRQWVEYGGGAKFSVKGKSYNELQAELSRVNHFINSKTSTVRGANAVLKSLANTAGISYKRVGEINAKASQFFELASKVDQYLSGLSGVASSIGYQKIWNVINQYVQENQVDLGDSENNLESMIGSISVMLDAQYNKDVADQIYKDIFRALS